VHFALDEMKNSLSFISSKLDTNQTRNNLSSNEITQLQDRLASTEAQMYKILNALDAASNQVNQLTKNTRQTLEQPQQVIRTIKFLFIILLYLIIAFN
jgi:chromosome segregation ATPase